jgi:glycosyltransferase involved in cell wall biosynthesis
LKPHVLQLIGSFHQGGSERQAVQLTRLLVESGEVRVFAGCLNGEGVLREEIEELNLGSIAEFPLTSFYDSNFLKQIRRLAGFIKENKIELIHTHDFYTNIFGITAARIARIEARIASKRETGGMRSATQKFIEKQAFGLSRAIVANSEAVKNYLVSESVPENKIRVIYNGLDLERLKPEIIDRSLVLREFDLPSEKKIITIVANLRHAVKNQEMFLRAARRVKENVTDAAFVLAGEGERTVELKALAVELGIESDCFFIGRCERVAELLSISDVCVLSSTAEGFSNSILEYMAASVPVVATRVGGAAEAIRDGESGFIVETDDDEKMAAQITLLLENPSRAQAMGRLGRQIVEERFSLRAQLENTLALYSQVLTQK